MNSKKLSILFLACLLFLTGCQVNKNSLKFKLDNNDSIVVKVRATDGYTLEKDGGRYNILKDGETVLVGGLVTYETFKALSEQVLDENNKEVIAFEEGKIFENSYIYYEVIGADGVKQYNVLLSIMYSNSASVLSSTHSKEAVLEALDHLDVRSDLNVL